MQYLQEFPNKKQEKYFVTDMNSIYKDLAREYFPNATIVVDKFHVIRYVTWALENVRKRIQKEFEPCLTMLGNCSKYILNFFECKYTNGFTEGTNNAIKVINRNAFGYRNFNNFRNRIFLSLT